MSKRNEVTRWRVAEKPGHRPDAWEVCIPVGNGSIDIVTFTGPNAAGRSARYAEQHGWTVPDVEPEEPSIEDLLS